MVQLYRARMAFGGLAHKPWRVEAAENAMTQTKADDSTYSQAGDTILGGARGYGANDFKIPLTKRVLTATLREAVKV